MVELGQLHSLSGGVGSISQTLVVELGQLHRLQWWSWVSFTDFSGGAGSVSVNFMYGLLVSRTLFPLLHEYASDPFCILLIIFHVVFVILSVVSSSFSSGCLNIVPGTVCHEQVET